MSSDEVLGQLTPEMTATLTGATDKQLARACFMAVRKLPKGHPTRESMETFLHGRDLLKPPDLFDGVLVWAGQYFKRKATNGDAAAAHEEK